MNVAGLDVPAPSSVWYGCMITAPRSPQYAFSVPIMSWKFTRRRLRLRPGSESSQAKAAVVLVRRRDHAERFACCARRDRRVRQRGREQALDAQDAFSRQRQRARAAALADRAAGRGRVADERPLGPALGTARQVRQVAGEPEQLQLEREHERVERRLRPAHLRAVENIQKPCQRLERARVSLLLREEPQHRLEPDEPHGQPVGLLARPTVRTDERRAGHGPQLAAPLVEHQLDVTQRLEPPAEPGLRAPDPLGDRADATELERVQVEDAIRLAEPERAQDDSLTLLAPPSHP